MTRIGLVGSGHIGSQIARLAVRNGYKVVVSNSRGPATLSGLVAELGPDLLEHACWLEHRRNAVFAAGEHASGPDVPRVRNHEGAGTVVERAEAFCPFVLSDIQGFDLDADNDGSDAFGGRCGSAQRFHATGANDTE
jgi:nucleoside-diphosphate-sugar epimerase